MISYSKWLDEWCERLGLENYIFMDARGKEHMICITMYRAAEDSANGIDRPQIDTNKPGIPNNWDRPWHTSDWDPLP